MFRQYRVRADGKCLASISGSALLCGAGGRGREASSSPGGGAVVAERCESWMAYPWPWRSYGPGGILGIALYGCAAWCPGGNVEAKPHGRPSPDTGPSTGDPGLELRSAVPHPPSPPDAGEDCSSAHRSFFVFYPRGRRGMVVGELGGGPEEIFDADFSRPGEKSIDSTP